MKKPTRSFYHEHHEKNSYLISLLLFHRSDIRGKFARIAAPLPRRNALTSMRLAYLDVEEANGPRKLQALDFIESLIVC